MPDRIEATKAGLSYVDSLISDGEKLLDDPSMVDMLALPIDERDREAAQKEGRPPKRQQSMDCPVALPIKQRHFGRWYGGSYAFLCSVAGETHPFTVTFKEKVYGSVVGCVDEGIGILAGFKEAWKSGNLWK